ncbi:cytochrome c oxidase accessory protein CcoG [Shewanella algae]|uniref:Quinol dehydrogenase membrane component n=1 Tax=Shewanella algae TaxID=38313 RepID=A0A379YZZ6_9GAMM|nr:cytochrome c oxidase accessory protein CcoG [Shewanella algae]MBO2606517.1 cytochrome c oxidase accessory protein CcoG [Shewanella algae]SUI52361.1 quinol dehydrogenase membrane component [Shewanella algae]
MVQQARQSSEAIPVTFIPSPQDKKSSHKGGKIHFRSQRGYFQRWRSGLNALLIALFLLLPFIDWQGRQAIWFDLANQQFYFFGSSLWPQDFTLLAWFFIAAAFALFFVTLFWGRVWCGYLCPQTAWTFGFAWVEEKLEGSRNQRIKLDASPMTVSKAGKRGGKHLLWMLMSLITGCGFIAYFVPAKQLYPEIFTFSAGFWDSTWVYFFALCTYLNAGWMREQMCLHCCPYARFQSAMFDSFTKTVTYDAQRGESRGPRKRKQATELGDCVDCNLCVEVCPTGIDIRNGLQYECINCGACVDACDQTMSKFGYRPGLISYTSEESLTGQTPPLWQRKRFIGYGAALLAILCTMGLDIYSRDPITLNVIRDRQSLYRETLDDGIENSYLLKIRNKTQQDKHYQIEISGALPYKLSTNSVHIAAGEQYELPLTLTVPVAQIDNNRSNLLFKVTEADAPDNSVSQKSVFFAP